MEGGQDYLAALQILERSKGMNYRRIVNIATLMIIVSMMAVSPVLAAKPDGSNGTKDVIAKGNGFPSGEHFNLNIHGKKAGYACNETPGGGSVFVDEYGPATIQYVTNKKSSVTNLTVLDPCAVNNGTAKVQLPYEGDGYLGPSDQIWLENKDTGVVTEWHVFDVATDIIVTPQPDKPPPSPEFPLGIGLLMMMALAIPTAYVWRLRRKGTKQ